MNEYKLELAHIALAKNAKGDSDAQKFNTLKWREVARTAAKRHHVEDRRRDKIVKKKRLAVKAVQNDADGSDGSEAEVDEELQETTPAQIVHLPDPKPVLNEETGMYIFTVSILIYFSICQYKF